MPRKPASASFDAATHSDKVLSRRVLVIIDREMTAKTSRAVWQHEIPILEAVFGEGKVALVDPTVLDEGFNRKVSPDLLPYNKVQDPSALPSQSAGLNWVFVGDARTEYDRLGMVYGSMPEEKRLFVEAVYGRFQDGRFEAVVGLAEVEDLPEPQLRDLIKGYGFVPAVALDSPDSDKAAARAKQKALQEAGQAELLAMADELGVTLN